MPYTEALACVLVASALLLLMRRHYTGVGLVALALGFTRGVAPALAASALVHLVIRWREDRAAGVSPLRGQRASAALMLAATAVSAGLAGARRGRERLPRAFFDVRPPGTAARPRPLRALAHLGLGRARHRRRPRHGRARRHLRRAHPRTARALARDRAAHVGAGVPSTCWRWWPITSMWRFLLLDFPVMALFASVAMRTSTGASVVPHWRRRVAVVAVALVIGMFWFAAALLTYTPGRVPALNRGQRPVKTGFSLARKASTAAWWSALSPVSAMYSHPPGPARRPEGLLRCGRSRGGCSRTRASGRLRAAWRGPRPPSRGRPPAPPGSPSPLEALLRGNGPRQQEELLGLGRPHEPGQRPRRPAVA